MIDEQIQKVEFWVNPIYSFIYIIEKFQKANLYMFKWSICFDSRGKYIYDMYESKSVPFVWIIHMWYVCQDVGNSIDTVDWFLWMVHVS